LAHLFANVVAFADGADAAVAASTSHGLEDFGG
jgi:hypothetical protein